DSVGRRRLAHALVEPLDLLRGGGGHGEPDQRPQGLPSLARDVREVHRHGLPADVEGRGPRAAEVHVFHDHVGRGEEARSRFGAQDRGVIADPELNALGPAPLDHPADQPDDLELGGGGGTTWRFARAHHATKAVRVSSRKFRRSALPWPVRIDSGWNCTPSTGKRRWRSPMISPSSARAEISSSEGKPSVSTTRE